MSLGNGNGRVEPGQPLSQAFSARAWNRAQDAADIVLGRAGGFSAGPSAQSLPPYTFVYLKNVTNWDLQPHQAIAIDGVEGAPLASPTGVGNNAPGVSEQATLQFMAMPVLRGSDPANGKCHAISLEPIAAGKIGRVAVAGVVQALVEESYDQTGSRVRPLGGNTGNLIQDQAGEFELLWRDQGEGPQWALIRFDRDTAPSCRLGKTSEEWLKNSEAYIQIWESGSWPNEEETPGQVIRAMNKFATIAEGKFVMLTRNGVGNWYVISAEC